MFNRLSQVNSMSSYRNRNLSYTTEINLIFMFYGYIKYILKSINSYNKWYKKISSLCNSFYLLPTDTLNAKLNFDNMVWWIFSFSKHFNTIYIFYDKSDKEFILSECVLISFFLFSSLKQFLLRVSNALYHSGGTSFMFIQYI